MCRTVGSYRHITKSQRAFVLAWVSDNGNGKVPLRELCRLLKKEFHVGFNPLAVHRFLQREVQKTYEDEDSSRTGRRKTKKPKKAIYARYARGS